MPLYTYKYACKLVALIRFIGIFFFRGTKLVWTRGLSFGVRMTTFRLLTWGMRKTEHEEQEDQERDSDQDDNKDHIGLGVLEHVTSYITVQFFREIQKYCISKPYLSWGYCNCHCPSDSEYSIYSFHEPRAKRNDRPTGTAAAAVLMVPHPVVAYTQPLTHTQDPSSYSDVATLASTNNFSSVNRIDALLLVVFFFLFVWRKEIACNTVRTQGVRGRVSNKW